MATGQSGGFCPKPDFFCCGSNCCDVRLCEECQSNNCVVVSDNKPTDAACGFNCECASGVCSGFLCL